MKKITLTSVFLLFVFMTFSQQQKLSLNEIIGNPRKFYPENLPLLKWRNNACFAYFIGKDRLYLMRTIIRYFDDFLK